MNKEETDLIIAELEKRCANYEMTISKMEKGTCDICKEIEKDKRIAELEKENIELKTKKIPQLERRIASIRGSHRVDVRKLNARIEQVERLKKENAELKDDNKVMADNYSKMEQKFYDNLTKAKEIIKDFLLMAKVEHLKDRYETVDEAEQFLKENA